MNELIKWNLRDRITITQYEDWSFKTEPSFYHSILFRAGGMYGHVLGENPIPVDLNFAIGQLGYGKPEILFGENHAKDPAFIDYPDGVRT